MIIPCIDLMDRKVVQLVQGKEKFLELPEPLAVLEEFSAHPEIQVIDLDAAMGKAENNAEIVRELCHRKPCRVGGGIRSTARAQAVVGDGALKAIVGSSAFTSRGVNQVFLRELAAAVHFRCSADII
jgi:phosphoribosylformimino-5-aminoimidazole carboxamide ribonucleotide (ProFAR) isomerase